MIDKSGVLRVRVVGDEENDASLRQDGLVPFRFVGTRESIRNAKALLDYHVSYLKVVPAFVVVVRARIVSHLACESNYLINSTGSCKSRTLSFSIVFGCNLILTRLCNFESRPDLILLSPLDASDVSKSRFDPPLDSSDSSAGS